ncbi:MAG TPA: HEAT repeat domain-containing protein [Actinomycetota bacterium]
MAENDRYLSGPRTTTLSGDGGQASGQGGFGQAGQVEAYEEDWYRSLKALAERRRDISEDDEPEETADDQPAEDGDRPNEIGLAPEPEAQAAAEAELPLEPAPASQAGEPSTPTQEPQLPGRAEEIPIVEASTKEPGGGIPAPQEGPSADVTTPQAAASLTFEMPLPEAEASPARISEASPDLEAPAREPVPMAATPEPALEGTSPGPALEQSDAPVSQGPLLSSRDPQERRRALIELSTREPSDEELERICGLLLDPDREVRLLAVQTLAGFPERVDDEAVRRAIQDPDDEIRAAAVRLAAHREPCEVALLSPLLAVRRHPRTQRTVMDILPSVISSSGPTDQDVAAVVLAVAEMEPAPDAGEREGLARVAHALGPDRLTGALSLGEPERLGAVRLLLDESSPAVLQALAGLVGDPLEEVRVVAQRAADEVARSSGSATDGSATEGALQGEPLGSVAAGLTDPDPIERERAGEELRRRDRDEILAWALDRVVSGTSREAELAALVAGRVELPEVAPALLDRTIGLPSQERRVFLEALRSVHPNPAALVDALDAIEPARRPQAVDLLWETCGQELIPHVSHLLTDESPPVRVAALDGLAGTANPLGVEVAEAALANDPSPAVRAAAVRTLGRCIQGSPAHAPERAPADPDPDVRATALQTFPTASDVQISDLVSRSLSDPDERVRRAAMHRFAELVGTDREGAWAALRSCPPRERGELVAALQQTESGLTELAFERLRSLDEQERVLAVEVVGWGGSPGCVEAAIHALGDPSAQVRRSAVASLGRLRDPSAASALGKALVDPDPDVRIGAVGALGVIDDESVLGALVTALKDPEPRVRETASQVLTEWSSPAVARRLASVLAVPSLRDSAADLLTGIGPASVELLIDVLRQGNPALSSIVGGLLQQVVGIDDLLGRLSAPDPERRLRAVEAVGAVGGSSAVDALIRTLFDPDERIRIRSAQLLGTLGDRRAEQPVKQAALEDPDPEVVQAASEALARLGAEDGGRAAASGAR